MFVDEEQLTRRFRIDKLKIETKQKVYTKSNRKLMVWIAKEYWYQCMFNHRKCTQQIELYFGYMECAGAFFFHLCQMNMFDVYMYKYI